MASVKSELNTLLIMYTFTYGICADIEVFLNGMLTQCQIFKNLLAQLMNNPCFFVCCAGYGEPLSVSSPKEACVLRGDPC